MFVLGVVENNELVAIVVGVALEQIVVVLALEQQQGWYRFAELAFLEPDELVVGVAVC